MKEEIQEIFEESEYNTSGVEKMNEKYKIDEKIASFNIPSRWTIYGNMLLFSFNSFSSSQWTLFFSKLEISDKTLFYKGISEIFGVTHLALNGKIPPNDEMRIPEKFVPLYGDFGFKVKGNPTEKDFKEAFWASTKQNGIFQVWSPMYTMFSRGNIKEKARILMLPGVKDAIIADLYAGIGYFAFFYLKAKAKHVFCWEINPWSVEGLCRGAKLNNFKYEKVSNLDKNYENNQLIIFENNNILASKQLAGKIKNIRHINLGLLPSSEDSWLTCTKILDSEVGGWIHVHAAVYNKEIYNWTNKCKDKFTSLFKNNWKIQIQHVENVKQISPKKLHIVVDLLCIPKNKISPII
ncbi:hypothetical protein PNEG_00754 [Pneumocystis murina B123]|uniref:tRNA wybutosine-synthesizing protein 2 n=1 Tax=Pneumocystis murina (strain B123) TaxID=1069680 RepID=M7NR09_PNEMU|nr:hypothetical protein PNEG_00754 [Pneumocystis murina B123]EMR11158.1 hypothetical protein PNEG_00754 [Pneumocystis murina B123]